MANTPKHEDIDGSNLTGSDGSTNRTYTLANTGSIQAQFSIIIENTPLQAQDYTLSDDVITFLNRVRDNQRITLDYFVSDEVSSATYTNTLKVGRLSGLGIEIQNENLGIGDDTEKSYDLDNGNVVADSYDIKHAPATGASKNSFTSMVESTHYTIDKDGGSILLTAAGLSELGTNILYADYMHSPKLSDTILETFLGPASTEVDKITGNYWGPVKTTTDEVHDGREDNPYPSTDEPYVSDYDDPDFIQLNNLSVQTITDITFVTGTSERELDSVNYRFDSDGYITLLSDRLPLGKLNVEVTYTHGYSSTPDLICEMASLLAGIRAYVFISGGSYDDATSFTLGRKAITIGEAWVNIREVIDQAKKRVKELLNQHGPKMDVI